jgi:hypothetical protein
MAAQQIDPLLRDLVRDLNQAGFSTSASCQGKTCAVDFRVWRHCPQSFVTFQDPRVLLQRKARASRLGLFLYNGNSSVSALSGRETSMETVFARNLSFVSRMRELFGLPPRPPSKRPAPPNPRQPRPKAGRALRARHPGAPLSRR